MTITRQKKEDQVLDLENKLREAKSVVFAEFKGISVEAIKKIRKDLREADSTMKVIKKTLIKISSKKAFGIEISNENLTGQVAVILSNGEIFAGPKIIKKYGKEFDLKLTGGIFEEKALSKAQAVELADMLSKEELIAKMLGSFMSPIQGFYSVNKEVMSSFARVLDLASKK